MRGKTQLSARSFALTNRYEEKLSHFADVFFKVRSALVSPIRTEKDLRIDREVRREGAHPL